MSDKPNIVLRKARVEDLDDVVWVESLSTPTLSYVPHVWDMFLNDEEGDWSVEELDGKIMGCGKYSILPDGSAWLETLRVVPEAQGLGLGKRLYEHWLRLSDEKGVKAMRMYTGVKNVVSEGLAKRYGLSLAQTFHGTKMASEPFKAEHGFENVTDVSEATQLLMPLGDTWGGWMVMNRTYYKWSPELCKWLTENGMVQGPRGQRCGHGVQVHEGVPASHRPLRRRRGDMPRVREIRGSREGSEVTSLPVP